MKGKRIAAQLGGLVLAMAIVFVSSCGGSDVGGINTKANKFSGSAVTNFSGPDGDNPDARQDARALMVNRSYDFTASGFILDSGLAATSAGGNVSFGSGTGTLSVVGDAASVALGVAPADPSYSNVDLNGTFSAVAAQSAIDNAGNTFTVSWQMVYSHDGNSYEIHFDQVMTGTDFREV